MRLQDLLKVIQDPMRGCWPQVAMQDRDSLQSYYFTLIMSDRIPVDAGLCKHLVDKADPAGIFLEKPDPEIEIKGRLELFIQEPKLLKRRTTHEDRGLRYETALLESLDGD
jgi:hypothetical protein